MHLLGYTHFAGVFVELSPVSVAFQQAMEILGFPYSSVTPVILTPDLFRSESVRCRVAKLSHEKLASCIFAMATEAHEACHIRQLATATPVLQMALSQQVQMFAALDVLRALKVSGISSLKIPALSCYGPDDEQQDSKLKPLVGLVRMAAINDRVNRCHFGPAVGTIAEAVRFLNAVYAASDIKQVFCTRTPDALSCPNELSLSHLLEAEARMYDLRQLRLWSFAGVPDDLISQALEQLDAPGYVEVTEYFFGQLPDASFDLFAMVLHLALWTDVFISGAAIWEEVQPCWRFVRITEALKLHPLPIGGEPKKDFKQLSEELCTAAGIPTPHSIATRTLRKIDLSTLPPLTRDLYSRHLIFAKELLYGRFEPVNASLNTEVITHCLPWVRFERNLAYFQRLPNGLDAVTCFQLITTIAILEATLFTGNLAGVRSLHRRMIEGLISLGFKPIRTPETDFEMAVEYVTGFQTSEMIMQRP